MSIAAAPETEALSTDRSALEERRELPRLTPNQCKVEIRTVQSGTVIDESSGGIGLLVDQVRGLEVGQQVEINYADFPIRAEIRCIEFALGGRFRVGLKWLDPFLIKWLDPDQLSRIVDEDVVSGLFGREQARETD
jgi:hypothetical protein